MAKGSGGHTRRVRLLGGLQIDPGGARQRPIPTGAARSLLAYLLLRPERSHSRETLAEALWPDAAPGRGRRLLTIALHRLRRAVGRGWLTADREAIRLVDPDRLWIDVRAFERLIADGSIDALREAVALYGGPLLPEFYDDWCLAHRVSLEEAYRHALRKLAADAEFDRRLDEAFQCYHWLSATDPLDEAAQQGVMRVYIQSGHPIAALQQFERFAARLTLELGVEPAPETTALAERARRRADDPRPEPQPFVGRRHERAVVRRALDQPGGQVRVVLVDGDPGMGKSRLLEQIVEDGRRDGARVAVARAVVGAAQPPYAPLGEALSGTLTIRELEAAARAIGPARRSAVGALVGDPATVPSPSVALAPALAALLRRLAADVPWLLVLDDVHLAGPDFWAVVGGLVDESVPRLTVVLAYRASEAHDNPSIHSILDRVMARPSTTRLSLGGLALDDVVELAAQLAQPAPPARLSEIHALTEGNPLFVSELLGVPGGLESGLPATFLSILDRRLAGLEPAARLALDAAAVLGAEFSHGSWQSLSPHHSRAAEVLVAGRFIRAELDRYAFQHELVRERVYEAIPSARRRLLHRRAAEALRREGAAQGVLGWHLEQAGRARDAVTAYRRAASEALRRLAHPVALEVADRALAQLPVADRADRLSLLTLRQRALRAMLRMTEWRSTLDDAQQLATELGDEPALLDLLEGRLDLHTLDGQIDALEQVADEALALSRVLLDTHAEARLLATIGWHRSESLGDHRTALSQLRRAAQLSEDVGDEQLQLTVACRLSWVLRSLGRSRAAHTAAARALALTETRPGLATARAMALAELAEVDRDLARWEDARTTMHAALDAYRELDDPWSYGAALYGMALIAGAMGRPEEAIEASRELVALSQRLGLAPDSEYGAWHRVSLARGVGLAGDYEPAEGILSGVRAAAIAAPRPAIAFHGVRGQLRLLAGRTVEAAEDLAAAVEIWRRRPAPIDAAWVLWLAVAESRLGHTDAAGQALADAERALSGTELPRLAVLLDLARHEVRGDGSALAAAEAAIGRQAERIRDPDLRRDFLGREPVVGLIRGARRRVERTGQVTMRLAAADAPLGRGLAEHEWVEVAWNADEAEPDEAPSPARRRRRLRQLLDAAALQGAAATDEQLAAALGVSRRTILRDMRTLIRDGQEVRTRRRR